MILLIVNLFMEEFESKVMNSTPNPSRLWYRYVDDTFVIEQVEQSHQFLQQISSIDPHMQFTMENPKGDRSIPCLDTHVSLGLSNTLITSV